MHTPDGQTGKLQDVALQLMSMPDRPGQRSIGKVHPLMPEARGDELTGRSNHLCIRDVEVAVWTVERIMKCPRKYIRVATSPQVSPEVERGVVLERLASPGSHGGAQPPSPKCSRRNSSAHCIASGKSALPSRMLTLSFSS